MFDPSAIENITAYERSLLGLPSGYVVKPKDTLFGIAAKLGINPEKLAESYRASGGNINVIKPGQVIEIPPHTRVNRSVPGLQNQHDLAAQERREVVDAIASKKVPSPADKVGGLLQKGVDFIKPALYGLLQNLGPELGHEEYENRVRSMHENPARYIFTNVKAKPGKRFSSAFGPAQITYTLAKEVLKTLGDSEEDAEYRDYLNSFIQQGKARVNQLQNQRALPGFPTATVDKNLRGKAHGRMHIDDHRTFYPRLFEDALQIKIDKAGSDPKKIFKHWYGHTDKKKMASYLKETVDKYGKEKKLNIPKIKSIIMERQTGPFKNG